MWYNHHINLKSSNIPPIVKNLLRISLSKKNGDAYSMWCQRRNNLRETLNHLSPKSFTSHKANPFTLRDINYEIQFLISRITFEST